ncbi:MAG: phosphotransferase [Pirellulaceae bacterium]|nr:phosphotransferase [Pirellulaceae bacterium]
MFELTEASATDYFRAAGRVAAEETAEVRELVGGVSNLALLVELPDRGERFVLKQARGKLRVRDDWQCSIERIWREVQTLRTCGELLDANSQSASTGPPCSFAVPRILWEDRENYAYAMTAAPHGHRTWKEILLAGETEPSQPIAAACGILLATLHGRSWNDPAVATRLADRSFFDALRLDPYYRQIARVHPDLAAPIERLIASVWEHRLCLVHGDFSPKNLLVWPGHALLIDFEVGHFGDPAFDLGFFLTHLALKSIWAGERGGEYRALAADFWRAYRDQLASLVSPTESTDLEERTVLNLAGCLLARVDGKSPVDYLAPPQQAHVRALAREWICNPPTRLTDALAATFSMAI